MTWSIHGQIGPKYAKVKYRIRKHRLLCILSSVQCSVVSLATELFSVRVGPELKTEYSIMARVRAT